MVVKRWMAAVVLTTTLLLGVIGVGLVTAQGPDGATTPVVQNEAGEIEEGDGTEDGNEGPDVAITGSALDQASAVALGHIGEGRVTDTEVGDEEGYYEIEITLDNGGEVDVHLDENFNVLSTEAE